MKTLGLLSAEELETSTCAAECFTRIYEKDAKRKIEETDAVIADIVGDCASKFLRNDKRPNNTDRFKSDYKLVLDKINHGSPFGIWGACGLPPHTTFKALAFIRVYMEYYNSEKYLRSLRVKYSDICVLQKRFGLNLLEVIVGDPWLLYRDDILSWEETSSIIYREELSSPNDKGRLYACLKHCMEESGKKVLGADFLPEDDLYRIRKLKDEDFLNDRSPIVRENIHFGKKKIEVFVSRDMYEAEIRIVNKLYKIYNLQSKKIVRENSLKTTDFPDSNATGKNVDGSVFSDSELSRLGRKMVERYESLYGYSGIDDFAVSQRKAVANIYCSEGLTMLTGGPGSGKTTMLRLLAKLWAADGRNVYLLAATGCAVRKIENMLGQSRNDVALQTPVRQGRILTSTVHKFVYANIDKTDKQISRTFQADENAPIFVLDECSMLGTEIFDKFLSIIPDSSRLVLCGDADQLSIPNDGQPFADMLKANVFQHIKLHGLYRYRNDAIRKLAALTSEGGDTTLSDVSKLSRTSRSGVYLHHINI